MSNIIQAKNFFNTQICKADIEAATRGIEVAIIGLSNLQAAGIIFANSWKQEHFLDAKNIKRRAQN